MSQIIGAEKRMWVGMLRMSGHPLATFLVAELVAEETDSYIVRNVVRAMEMPTENGGVGVSYMNDGYFTTNQNAKVERSCLIMGRILDPDYDSRQIMGYEGFMTRMRVARAGLVPGAQTNPGVKMNLGMEKK